MNDTDTTAHGDQVATFQKDGVTGWACPTCDKLHHFGVYVFAHWDDELVHKCDCGQSMRLMTGTVTCLEA